MIRQVNGFLNSGIRIFCVFLIFFLFHIGCASAITVRLLYVNDFHGFAEPYEPLGSNTTLGGAAYLAGEIERLRAEEPSLLLSAGDMLQGNIWANFFKGEPVIELMNQMKFDAMVVGNHEFDFGQAALDERTSEANFPVLGANVEGMKSLKPYVIKEIAGLKVAIIGVVTNDTLETTDPRNVIGLRFLSPADTVKKYLAELRGKADVFIVLSHIGFSADRTLAGEVKGIDVIIGGHSHTKLEKPVTVGKTIIVQAWEHGKALGVLDLTVEDRRIKKFQGHLDEIKPAKDIADAKVLAIVEKYQRKVDALLDGEVGESEVGLDGENVIRRETNLGDLIADVVRESAGADLAIINGGSIRTSIRKGDIRIKDIYSVLPFDDYIVAIRLTGKQILDALEHGVSAIGEGSGRFPQVSGVSFTFDPSQRAGSRIKEVIVEGQPLKPDREYSVATNDFLAAGGDGYKVFGEAIRASKDFSDVGGAMKGANIVYSDSGRWIKDIVVDYIREHKKISPKVEGRITEVSQ
jgi:5'-nucleotidase/UDP-sugar diphosphatase